MDPVFWELHSGLDREAPGDDADTLAALRLAGLSGPISVLDLGCGPGASALTLLGALPEAQVTGLDAHAPFLEAARAQVATAGFAERFTAVEADMGQPPFPQASFDLIWSEGAIYSIGVEAALAAWTPLLRPGGRLVFSDAVWLTDAPDPVAAANWAEYPAMTDAAGVRAKIAAADLTLLGDVELCDAAWDNYYRPLAVRATALEKAHGRDHPVLRDARAEIAARRDHPDDFAYVFFVAAA